MYYLAYNPNIGNALVAVSEQIIPEQEGIVVQLRNGDMPNLDRYAWNTAILEWYEKVRRRVSKLEYMNRFTDEELAGIYSMAKVAIPVEVWLAKFNAATPEPDGTSIDLDDTRTASGLFVLEAVGLLASGRANEILGL